MNLRHAATGLLPLAVLAFGASNAIGQTDGKDTLSFAFTTAKAKSSAGYNMEGEFPKQRVIDQLTLTFPSGTKFDTKAVKQCTTTQEQIEQSENGVSSVCPAASKIGTGKGTAFLGDAANPITFDLGVYNVSSGALLDITLNGKTAFTAPITISGRKQIIDLGLAPELNSRITAFELSVKKAGTAKKPYLRTPATCPKSKKLSASVTAREHNAGSVTTSDTTTCKK